MYTTSDNMQQLFHALALAQGEMQTASFDAKNPHFKSKYSTLSSVLGAILPALNRNGLSLMQHPSFFDGDLVSVTTLVTHSSGQWMRSTMSMPIGKRRDAHAIGSCISYLRRYSASSICGLMQGDDDGNAAVGRAVPVQAQPARPAAPPVPKVTLADVEQACLDVDLTLAELNTWCVSVKRPQPAKMNNARRVQVIRWLRTDKGDMVRAHFKALADASEQAEQAVTVPTPGGDDA
jgi:hypothetical protein|tara:strand:- start:1683 stop:2387 length:705 start_codon:yes stop_codon:yes gene_type:complete